MRIIGLISLAFMVGVGIYIWQNEIGEDEIFILPEGYRGVVFILYDQKKGVAVKYDQGKRVYEIPSNGILKTQFSLNTDWHSFGDYFFRDNGKQIKIPFVLDGKLTESNKNIDPNEVHVCCHSSGKSYYNDRDGFVEFGQFYVGTKDEISAASQKAEKFTLPT